MVFKHFENLKKKKYSLSAADVWKLSALDKKLSDTRDSRAREYKKPISAKGEKMNKFKVLLGLIMLISPVLSACGPAPEGADLTSTPDLLISSHYSNPLQGTDAELNSVDLPVIEIKTESGIKLENECDRHRSFYSDYIEFTFDDGVKIKLSLPAKGEDANPIQTEAFFTLQNATISNPAKNLPQNKAVIYSVLRNTKRVQAIAIINCPQGLLPIDPEVLSK